MCDRSCVHFGPVFCEDGVKLIKMWCVACVNEDHLKNYPLPTYILPTEIWNSIGLYLANETISITGLRFFLTTSSASETDSTSRAA